MPSPRDTEARIRRTLRAWVAETGEAAGALEVAPDGTVRVLARAADSPATSHGSDDEETRCAAAFGVRT